MMDALLVSDQHVNESFLGPKSAPRSGVEPWPQGSPTGALADPQVSFLIGSTATVYAERNLQGMRDQLTWRHASTDRQLDEEATGIDAHFHQAQHSLEYLAGVNKRAQEDRQARQEMRWLAEHRHEYSGRWIALRGEHLLAVGATAKEVFSKVIGQDTLPLVIRVEEEELPFAGW